MVSDDVDQARRYRDTSWTGPIKIVGAIIALLFLLNCAGALGYYIGFNTELPDTININETPIPTSTETIQPTTEPSFETSTILPTEEYGGPQAEDCDSVCSRIISGNITNHPVGFATIGSEALVFPEFAADKGVEVYCDCTDGSEGAWTVFQRRMDGSEDFERDWADYAEGFGNITGEFWLGLDIISSYSSGGEYELRVDLKDWDNNIAYAQYSIFSVGDSSTNYILTVDLYIGSAHGSAGDSLIMYDSTSTHSGMQFTTRDRDNDNFRLNCAVTYTGAWWFNQCRNSHLNGKYYIGGGILLGEIGVMKWNSWVPEDSLQAAEMKLRKK